MAAAKFDLFQNMTPVDDTQTPSSNSTRHGYRNVLRFLSRKLLDLQWFLGYKFGEAENGQYDLQTFEYLNPTADRQWADPFPVKVDGKFHVFLEEYFYHNRKGVISVISQNDDGGWSKPKCVLETDYHLSYPFMFEWDDSLFMIPETSSNRSVELYRCVSFPYEWKFEKYIMKDVSVVDATILEKDNLLWMFLNTVDGGTSLNDKLSIYYSDDLFGDWKPHKQNPVKVDVRSTRPGGKIINWNNELYRPGQDCSARYGYGITFNKMVKLSVDDYSEEKVARILPTWMPNICGVHTVNFCDDLTVIDILRRKPKIAKYF